MRKRGGLIIIICIVICAGGSKLLRAADDDYFLTQEIIVSGTILDCREADINRDGLVDLILIVNQNDGRRSLQVYPQREAGRFPPSASQSLEISPTVSLVQVYDLDKDGFKELLIVNHEGMWLIPVADGKFGLPRQLIVSSTIFGGGVSDRISGQPFVFSLNQRSLAFLPTVEGVEVWEYQNRKFTHLARLPFCHALAQDDVPIRSFVHRRADYLISLPDIALGDSNGDRLADIYLLWPDHVMIYQQNNSGQFSTTGKLFTFQDNFQDNLCQAILVDCNQDGLLDLICSRTGGGLSGAFTEIRFFGSTEIINNRTTPKAVIKLADICGNIMVGDHNGRGGPELVVPSVELGIMSSIKKLISGQMDVYLLVYPIDNLGQPAKEPVVRRKLGCRLNFDQADPTDGFRVDWFGDYNGDGILDLVTAEGGGQLMFYTGNAEEYLENKAALVLDITDPDIIIPTRLNSDRGSDLIIIHKQGATTNRLSLLVTGQIS